MIFCVWIGMQKLDWQSNQPNWIAIRIEQYSNTLLISFVTNNQFKSVNAESSVAFLDQHHDISIEQWFLTFFAPRTPKSQNNFHGTLNCNNILQADPLIPEREVKMGTVLYFSDLHGPPDQACTTYGPRTKCGPRKLLIWPGKPQILFILLVSSIKTLFECVTTN